MKITLKQLKAFITVAESLSYTRASEKLFMSQPAVSKQIKQLEEAVNSILFEKVGKKIFLTDAGIEMLNYAKSILSKVAEAKDHLAELRGGNKGRLKIAAATTASSFAIDTLGQFRKLYPDVEFEFSVNNRKTLLSNLDHNLVDLVIMGLPPENSHYRVEAFMKNPLVFVSSVDHPLVGKAIKAADLVNETFVVREEGSGTRQAMEVFFADKSLDIHIGMLFNSNESIKTAVMSGFGIALVSLHTVQRELQQQQISVLKVEDTPLERYWYLVHLEEKRLSAAIGIFKDYILEKVAEPSLIGI
jgi:DNA-binding transcriptional LysR family regulator